jgi:acetyltransferase-like isoleucine patch superfamily enzyme
VTQAHGSKPGATGSSTPARISDQASVHPGARIGDGTTVWQFAVVLDGAIIGADCNLNAHTLVEGGARIGDRVTLKCGVYVWSGIILEDDVFCGPNATFTNDRRPRSKVYPDRFDQTIVRRGASIGAGAVLLPGITIGENALIGAGAVVTRDVPAGETWVGNPARRLEPVEPNATE